MARAVKDLRSSFSAVSSHGVPTNKIPSPHPLSKQDFSNSQQAAKEGLFINRMIRELGIKLKTPRITIGCGNTQRFAL
jgi:hypothetical protein